jgi:hypothetical protein
MIEFYIVNILNNIFRCQGNSMRGFKSDIKSFPTQVKGDILEIDLSAGDSKVDVSTNENVSKLLSTCTSRVDVILDPSFSPPLWYPYWEGKRKMAPQFRSRGIGYLRLGDDMSQFGTAFLSTDAGRTFLDNGASSGAVDTSIRGTPSSLKYKKSNRISSAGKSRFRSQSVDNPMSTDENISFKRSKDIEEIREVLTSLKSTGSSMMRPTLSMQDGNVNAPQEVKWAERSELLLRLANLCTYSFEVQSCAETIVTEIITVLMENITKQKNPHVLKATLQCIRRLGGGGSVNSSGSSINEQISKVLANCGVAWRALLVETIHLLRVVRYTTVFSGITFLYTLSNLALILINSRVVADEAKEVLLDLHEATVENSINVAWLLAVMEDILAGYDTNDDYQLCITG